MLAVVTCTYDFCDFGINGWMWVFCLERNVTLVVVIVCARECVSVVDVFLS